MESPTDRGQFRTLGCDAVRAPTVQVDLPGGRRDLPVEAVEATHGLGMDFCKCMRP